MNQLADSNSHPSQLPPGQQIRADFPRFGVPDFADFTAPATDCFSIELVGDVSPQRLTQQDLAVLERVQITADFHCVTTWTYPQVCWSGYRFKDVYDHFLKLQVAADEAITAVTFVSLDRYRASLPLVDALAENVLLADTLNGERLTSKHGAPLRLVAPAHYGYKNVKHLGKIGLWRDSRAYKPFIRKFMEHPRGRVAYEERGRYFPGWLLRLAYRPLIERTIRQFDQSEHVIAKED